MNRKQRKKDAREQSTRQLMGIDDFTDYGIATRMGFLLLNQLTFLSYRAPV